MKTPGQNPNDKYEATQADIREANSRALQAREEALLLRQKLEAMESLLATTKSKLAETKDTLAAKDQRLKDVQSQTAAITQCLSGLDERFSNLKKLQNELAEKRDKLFPPDAPSSTTDGEKPALNSEGSSSSSAPLVDAVSEVAQETVAMMNETLVTPENKPVEKEGEGPE